MFDISILSAKEKGNLELLSRFGVAGGMKLKVDDGCVKGQSVENGQHEFVLGMVTPVS